MSVYETLILDGLDLNGVTGIRGRELDWKPARKILEWVKSADADGAVLLRPPKHELAQLTIKLRIERQANMDAAIELLQGIIDKLQMAERISAGGRNRGIELQVSPAGSTKTGTVYVQAGEVEDLPRDHGDGWFRRGPTVTIRLDCDPFVYSDEIVYPAEPGSQSTPLHELEVPDVGGDVNAEARLIFTDLAGKHRDLCAWGLENGGYQPGTDLLIVADDLVTAGMAGSPDSEIGAYPSSDVVSAALTSTPVAICSTGNIALVGVFKLIARVVAHETSAGSVSLRGTYRSGDGPFKPLPWETVTHGNQWIEADLGTVTLPEAHAGLQVGEIRLEAQAEIPGDEIAANYLILRPVADVGGGVARTPMVLSPPASLTARDEFDQAAGALNGKTMAKGGTWTRAGDTTDYAVNATDHVLERTAVSDTGGAIADVSGCFALAGATVFTDVAARVDFKTSSVDRGLSLSQGLVLRYGSTTDTVLLAVIPDWNSRSAIRLFTWNGIGVGVGLIGGDFDLPPLAADTWYSLAVVLRADGRYAVWLAGRGLLEHTLPVLHGASQDLSPTSAYSSGRVGIYDCMTAPDATTRSYENFAAWVPAPASVCHADESLEFRTVGVDAAIREDPSGTFYGVPPEYRGARFSLPPGASRVVAMPRRYDTTEYPADHVTDAGQLQVAYRERRLVLPG